MVAVGRVGRPEYGVQEGAPAEDVADAAREGDWLGALALGGKVRLDALLDGAWRGDEEDVMLVGGG